MPLTRKSIFVLSTLAGTAAAAFFRSRRQSERAEAIRDKVEGQDWESAPIKPAAPGAQIPAPEEVAREVTGK